MGKKTKGYPKLAMLLFDDKMKILGLDSANKLELAYLLDR